MDSRLRLLVLGSAAGGGYPQWNCLCDICRLYWNGDPRVAARSQSSIAVSADGNRWLLLNASPDLRQQILSNPKMQPSPASTPDEKRRSPIGAVLVTNGDVDHVAGLLTLREKQDFRLYATSAIHALIEGNPVFNVLDRAHVEFETVQGGRVFAPFPGLSVEIFAVPGKVPLYMEKGDVDIGEESDMTVGVRISAHGKTAFYIPGCAKVTDGLRDRLKGADILLFDGTVFVDDEMEKAGVGMKTGRRMGHMPISGEGGSLEAFRGVDIGSKTYIHINNTNPILVDGSKERQEVEAQGWQVAFDGMEIVR